MASSVEVQVFIEEKFKQCVAALQKIAMLADIGSELHRKEFGPDSATGWTANGWRVAGKMREVANDVVGSLPLEEDFVSIGCDTSLTPDHMAEEGWSYDQMSFTHGKKLKDGVLLVRSASQTYLLVDSNAGFQRCDLQHVETVSDFRRLCETFGI